MQRAKKERIEEIFVLAEVTANRTLYGLSSKKSASDLLQPWHFYPSLFENKDEEITEAQEAQQEALYKARFNKHVEAWNRRFKEGHNDGPGKTES